MIESLPIRKVILPVLAGKRGRQKVFSLNTSEGRENFILQINIYFGIRRQEKNYVSYAIFVFVCMYVYTFLRSTISDIYFLKSICLYACMKRFNFI